MTNGPGSAEKAMTIVLGWIEAGTTGENLKLAPECLEQFRSHNMPGFEAYYTEERWKKSCQTLRVVASVHGTMSAHVARIREPKAKEVSLEVFVEVGGLIRKHCLPAESTGCPPMEETTQPGARGPWCQWP